MCLAVPGVIEELDGDMAIVRIEGIVIDANVALIEAPAKGDYVLVHAGYAIQRLEPEEAEEVLSLLREIAGLQDLPGDKNEHA